MEKKSSILGKKLSVIGLYIKGLQTKIKDPPKKMAATTREEERPRRANSTGLIGRMQQITRSKKIDAATRELARQDAITIKYGKDDEENSLNEAKRARLIKKWEEWISINKGKW